MAFRVVLTGLVVLEVVVAGLATVPARASEVHAVTIPSRGRMEDPVTTITYDGTDGDDVLRVTGVGAADVLLRDEGGLQAGPGCTAVDSTEARCPTGALTARLAGGEDQATVGVKLRATLEGGSGDDQLRGGPDGDTLIGGSGDDVLTAGGYPPTPVDVASYEDSPLPVTLDLRDGTARRADGTDRLTGFGEVRGSTGADTMYAPPAGGVRFIGGDGDDRLVGGSGDDELDAGRGNNVISGSAGADLLKGGGRLDGGAGNDELFGRRGAEILRGGPGADAVWTGGGNDRVEARDGTIDAITCIAPFPVGRTMRADLDAGDGSIRCRGLHRRGVARPAFFAAAADQEDFVGSVTLKPTCPQPLRNCEVTIDLLLTGGRFISRESLTLDQGGLNLGFPVFLDRAAERALGREGRLALTARLTGRDARGTRVVDHLRFTVRRTPNGRRVWAVPTLPMLTRTRGAAPTPAASAAPVPGTLPRALGANGRFVVRPGRLRADRTGLRSLVGDYTADGLAPLTWTSWTDRAATATGYYLRSGDCYPKCLDKDNPSGRWPLVSLRLFSVHNARFQRMTIVWDQDGERHTVRQHLIRRAPAGYEWASRAGGPYWDDHLGPIPTPQPDLRRIARGPARFAPVLSSKPAGARPPARRCLTGPLVAHVISRYDRHCPATGARADDISAPRQRVPSVRS